MTFPFSSHFVQAIVREPWQVPQAEGGSEPRPPQLAHGSLPLCLHLSHGMELVFRPLQLRHVLSGSSEVPWQAVQRPGWPSTIPHIGPVHFSTRTSVLEKGVLTLPASSRAWIDSVRVVSVTGTDTENVRRSSRSSGRPVTDSTHVLSSRTSPSTR